jgi:hypothetical protein
MDKIETDKPEFNPYIYGIAGVKEVKITRYNAQTSRQGHNRYIRIYATWPDGKPAINIRFVLQTSHRPGVLAPVDIWAGNTDERGELFFLHDGVPRIYELWYNNHLVVSNIRTDLPWNEYLSPDGKKCLVALSAPPGWILVNTPGMYGYSIQIVLDGGWASWR